MASIYTHQSVNQRKTLLLFSLFLIIIIGVGWFFSFIYGNSNILYVAVIFSILMNVVAYWHSDKIVLKMSGARPADKNNFRELHNIVENLSITAGLPKPRVFIVYEKQPNAFATGRNPEHGVVAVTEGLLELLNRSELEGVLAHELAHIGNRDILVSTAAVVLVGFVSIISDIFLRSFMWRSFSGRGNNKNQSGFFLIAGIVLALLAPLGALLIQLAISRKREFLADASAALLTRYPDGLARALEKLEKNNTPMQKSAKSSTAHLWLVNPFKGSKLEFFSGLFRTHPLIIERVEKLRQMA